MQDVVSKEDVGRYDSELAVMREMGWSWHDLCTAPADLVEEIEVRLASRGHWNREKKRLDEALGK